MILNRLIQAIAIPMLFILTSTVKAGYFSHQSESYLTSVRNLGGGVYQCTYKTNPGNRGWRNFNVNFQNGCPRFVHYNATNGQVSVPN